MVWSRILQDFYFYPLNDLLSAAFQVYQLDYRVILPKVHTCHADTSRLQINQSNGRVETIFNFFFQLCLKFKLQKLWLRANWFKFVWIKITRKLFLKRG